MRRDPNGVLNEGVYVLDADGNVQRATFEEWANWFEAASRDGTRIVKQDFAEGSEGRVGVSTVFLGIDHNFSGVGPPILWESMVFGIRSCEAQRRYRSREAALAGHAELVKLATEAWLAEQERAR